MADTCPVGSKIKDGGSRISDGDGELAAHFKMAHPPADQ